MKRSTANSTSLVVTAFEWLMLVLGLGLALTLTLVDVVATSYV